MSFVRLIIRISYFRCHKASLVTLLPSELTTVPPARFLCPWSGPLVPTLPAESLPWGVVLPPHVPYPIPPHPPGWGTGSPALAPGAGSGVERLHPGAARWSETV